MPVANRLLLIPPLDSVQHSIHAGEEGLIYNFDGLSVGLYVLDSLPGSPWQAVAPAARCRPPVTPTTGKATALFPTANIDVLQTLMVGCCLNAAMQAA